MTKMSAVVRDGKRRITGTCDFISYTYANDPNFFSMCPCLLSAFSHLFVC